MTSRTSCIFLMNEPPTTESYTLSLHDALPISRGSTITDMSRIILEYYGIDPENDIEAFYLDFQEGDRKSTRLNSSHVAISYAVFCLKKKKHIISMPMRKSTKCSRTSNINRTQS